MNWTVIKFIAVYVVLAVLGAIFLLIDTKAPALGLGSTPFVVVVIIIVVLGLVGIPYMLYTSFMKKNANNKTLSESAVSEPGSGERKNRRARR